jgi:hypothetical protein
VGLVGSYILDGSSYVTCLVDQVVGWGQVGLTEFYFAFRINGLGNL